MVVFLNGRFMDQEAALVSVFDRGFLYGDGLFETLRVFRGRPFLWEAHMQRFAHGASVLKLRPPLTSAEMRHAADRLIELNASPNAVLRITLTRGPGPRGYSPKGADTPTLAMTLHLSTRPNAKRPAGVRLITSTFRVHANDPLGNIKTCNKLPHILARAEADTAEANDALLLNTHGQLAEATASNLFWISGNALATPPARAGGLMGITRGVVCDLGRKVGMPTVEMAEKPSALTRTAGVFLTSSGSGITEVVALDGQALHRSPLVRRLQMAYETLLRMEST